MFKFTQKKINKITFLSHNSVKLPIKVISFKSWSERFDKLINSYEIPLNTCYRIINTSGFHSFYMNYNVDIFFVTKNNIVVETIQDFEPNKITGDISDAYYCIICPNGFIQRYDINIQDLIRFKKEIVIEY